MIERRHVLMSGVTFLLAGCGFGESRLNPFNWFRSSPEEETLAPFQIVVVEDRRPLVAEVTSLEIDRTPGGAILRATGLPPTQGWFDAGLVDETGGEPIDGVLSYSFRASPPPDQQRVSTERSRELVVARFISDITLAQVRVIQVTGAQNSRIARR